MCQKTLLTGYTMAPVVQGSKIHVVLCLGVRARIAALYSDVNTCRRKPVDYCAGGGTCHNQRHSAS